MLLGIQTPEINVNQIEIYKMKSKSVDISEILKQGNARDHKSNSETINVINVDTAVTNVQEPRRNALVTNVYRLEKGNTNARKVVDVYPGSDKHTVFQTDYWVLSNILQPNIDNDSPLSYTPDRNAFIARVFEIVTVMLVTTASIVAAVYTTELREIFLGELRHFILIGATVSMFMLNYTMMCFSCGRRLPCNIVVLSLAVCFMSVIASYATVIFSTDIILIALIVTIITVIACMGLAYTRFDFTRWWLYIFVLSVSITLLAISLSVIMIITKIRYKPLDLGILFVGTCLNVIILVMELQSILGGKTVELNEDDYALAAYMLYSSLVNLFTKVVSIVGYCLDDD